MRFRSARWHSKTAATALVLCFGCSRQFPAITPPASPSSTPAPGQSSPHTSATSSRTRMESPEQILAPADTVCSLDALSYEPEAPIPIKLRGDGQPYAFVWSARHARADLGADDPQAFVSLKAGNLTLSGMVDGIDLPLHPRRAITFSGMVIAGTDARLRLMRARAQGELEIMAKTGPTVIPLRGPLSARCSCHDLSLSREFIAEPEVRSSQFESLDLPDCSKLKVAGAPGNAPSLQLDLSYSDNDNKGCMLSVVRRGGFGLLETVTDGLAIRGWVRVPPKRGTPGEGEWGMTGLLNVGTLPLDEVPGEGPHVDANPSRGPVCAWHAPLAVRFEGYERIVGTVGPNAAFRIIGGDEWWAEIELDKSEVQFAPWARLRVPVSALFPCH